MALNELTEIHPISNWQVRVLRCTAFYNPDEQFDISGWWAEMMGDLPEKEIKKAKAGISIEEGPCKEGDLTLTKSPIAVDLRLHLADKLPDEINGIPTIGNFEERCPEYVALVKKMFDVATFPSVKRLAFGSIINFPSKDQQDAYTKLSAYIKNVKIDPVKSRDIIYRINRRRISKIAIPGLDINRLSTWNVIKYQAVAASLVSEKMTTTKVSEISYACQLQIDINTSEESENELPKEKLGEIFDELVDMGKEIISQGDIE